MEKNYEALKLENQLCFPLYAASRDVIKQYKPMLDKLELTYTQYIVMMVLWERQQITTKEMGKMLHLDSGTLTPLLKKLEKKVNEVDLASAMGMAKKFAEMTGKLTEEGIVNAYINSDMHKKNLEEIAESKKESNGK